MKKIVKLVNTGEGSNLEGSNNQSWHEWKEKQIPSKHNKKIQIKIQFKKLSKTPIKWQTKGKMNRI
jgi:hypothetical protein